MSRDINYLCCSSSRAESEPVLVKSVKNGHLYTVGANNNISKQVHLVHVYGTAYEMGYAQGALLGDELKVCKI